MVHWTFRYFITCRIWLVSRPFKHTRKSMLVSQRTCALQISSSTPGGKTDTLKKCTNISKAQVRDLKYGETDKVL